MAQKNCSGLYGTQQSVITPADPLKHYFYFKKHFESSFDNLFHEKKTNTWSISTNPTLMNHQG